MNSRSLKVITDHVALWCVGVDVYIHPQHSTEVHTEEPVRLAGCDIKTTPDSLSENRSVQLQNLLPIATCNV